MERYLDSLAEHETALNDLNVYPVPDGDTGKNMKGTMAAVVAGLHMVEGMDDTLGAISHGALMGAQGNSGIILSQILGGLADAFRGSSGLGVSHVVDALDRASDGAYRAVGRPVEGTILTVLREASEAAAEAATPEGESLAALLQRVYDRAEVALESTPDLLPVLKQAGVVDAGGAGFLLLLAAFLEVVTGEDVTLPERIFQVAAGAAIRIADSERGEEDISGLRYEVMYLLAADGGDIGDDLRRSWAEIGDSIVVVGSAGTWNCHIHTDDIGGAIEAGIALGTPSRIKITDLLEQAADESAHREAEAANRLRVFPILRGAPVPDVGVVAVAAGDGAIEWFGEAGALAVVTGGQTMNPSVGDLLRAVEAVEARTVVILPNNRNIVAAAGQVDALTTKRVHVVSTTSVPQGLVAMVALPPSGDAEGMVASMSAAAATVTTGEITRAVREAITPAGRIADGDWLGIIDGEVRLIHGDCASSVDAVIAAIVRDDIELVTIVTGAESDPVLTGAAVANLEAAGIEVDLVTGGQPLYPYLFGAE